MVDEAQHVCALAVNRLPWPVSALCPAASCSLPPSPQVSQAPGSTAAGAHLTCAALTSPDKIRAFNAAVAAAYAAELQLAPSQVAVRDTQCSQDPGQQPAASRRALRQQDQAAGAQGRWLHIQLHSH